MPEPEQNGNGAREPVDLVTRMDVSLEVGFVPMGYQVVIAENVGDHPIRLLIMHQAGMTVACFDPTTAQQLANGLLQAVRAASSGLTIAKELPKDPPPRGRG